VCVSSASTGLCGGRRETRRPYRDPPGFRAAFGAAADFQFRMACAGQTIALRRLWGLSKLQRAARKGGGGQKPRPHMPHLARHSAQGQIARKWSYE